INYYFNNTPSKNTLRLTKFVCVDAPYQRTVLHYCKTIPRRNQSATLNVSLTVPEEINIVYFVAQLDYKSIPTGEYRLKVKFLFFDNVTLFSVHVFFNVRSKGLFRSMIEW
ncbi:uncharacterized protein LOC128276951, partial [Anopheles cruzii]|uniref:uncharacterized protein LOC128276951 n=1 Tax=Anopheles cruzii TaxID=68878 RepID=UPI0022EC6CC7